MFMDIVWYIVERITASIDDALGFICAFYIDVEIEYFLHEKLH